MSDNQVMADTIAAILNDEPFDTIFGEPAHPGKFLQEELLTPLNVSQSQLASDLDVPFRRINEIVNGKRAVTAETAILLAKYFDMSPQFWLGLQTQYDLDKLRGQMKTKLSRVRVLPRPDLAKVQAAPGQATVTFTEKAKKTAKDR